MIGIATQCAGEVSARAPLFAVGVEVAVTTGATQSFVRVFKSAAAYQ